MGFRIFAILLFLTIGAIRPAFSQTDYSTVWIDDTQAEDGIVYVVGAGVTENDYTNDDAVEVETTLTSPSGRTIAGVADGDIAARAEVRLPWDWNDTGIFSLRAYHSSLCEFEGGFAGEPGYRLPIMGVNIRIRPQYPYTPFYRCGLSRNTFMDRTFETGDVNSLDYYDVGQISPNTCGYKICPYGEEEYCYKPSRGQQTYELKGVSASLGSKTKTQTLAHYFKIRKDLESVNLKLPENPCWKFLRVNYMIIMDPWLGAVGVCARFGPKLPYDNSPPGNPCAL